MLGSSAAANPRQDGFGVAVNGLRLGIVADKEVRNGITDVIVHIVTRNATSTPIDVLPTYRWAKLTAVNGAGKIVSNGYSCPIVGGLSEPPPDTTLIPPGGERTEHSILTLSCYTSAPGTYSLKVTADVYPVGQTDFSKPPLARLTSNTVKVTIP
jgi:hypothetical protein